MTKRTHFGKKQETKRIKHPGTTLRVREYNVYHTELSEALEKIMFDELFTHGCVAHRHTPAEQPKTGAAGCTEGRRSCCARRRERIFIAHGGLAARQRRARRFARSCPCGGCAVSFRGQSSAIAHEQLLKALGAKGAKRGVRPGAASGDL
jgi:hypothetical protein